MAEPWTPRTGVECLDGVGPARARRLAGAGIRSLGQLLAWLPRTWESRAGGFPLGELEERPDERIAGVVRAFRGRVRRVRVHRFRGRVMVRAVLDDGSGQLPLVWFNSPWIAGVLQDEERERLVIGEPRRDRSGRWQLIQPRLEESEDGDGATRPRPVYPSIEGVGAGLLERWIGDALDGLGDIPEWIPADLLRRHDLPPLGEALRTLHRPGPDVDAETLLTGRSPAHRRLVYGELLETQLAFAERRRRIRASGKPHRIEIDDDLRSRLRDGLPFPLTGAQRRVLGEIVADLCSERPMQRLLQGDVGSGKTVVAGLAAWVALENGLQVAVMAPTGLLAHQLERSLRELIGDRHRIERLTAERSDQATIRDDLAAGRIGLVVGTHALFQGETRFRRLALTIVDEQHRFGVSQRRALVAKGSSPDLLVMTATPIPRSLALAAWGDLDLSVIDELPPGRRPVETEIVPVGRRSRVDREIVARVEAGERVYVVVPRIDDRDDELASVAEATRRLESLIGPGRLAVAHSRMVEEERQRSLEDFANGSRPLVVATTVVEVGVDVPEATLMVIEGAERYGLAQLHQLRGRVGRGSRPSLCLALVGEAGDLGRRRLEAFASTVDGFRLAELDLSLRGPGEALGDRQTGAVRFRAADPVRDVEWLSRAREDARRLTAEELAPPLRRRLEARLDRAGGRAG